MYQEIAGKRVPVAGRWTLHGHEGAFAWAPTTPEEELVIDPPLIYSSYYGGNGLDYAYAIAVDSLGNTYVAGTIGSANFSIVGTEDAFVDQTKPPRIQALHYFPGRGRGGRSKGGRGRRPRVHLSYGKHLVPQLSDERCDPERDGRIRETRSGQTGARRNASGVLHISRRHCQRCRLGNRDRLCTERIHHRDHFLDPIFRRRARIKTKKGAQQDTFVAKINAAGSALVYSAYLGGNNVDEGNAIAVDAAGNAYVTGSTALTNFPLQSPFRSSNLASVDAFVAKLNPAVSALVYSTYLGARPQIMERRLRWTRTGSAVCHRHRDFGRFPRREPDR